MEAKQVQFVVVDWLINLTFLIPALPNMNACRKTPPEIHFIYLGNKEI